MNKVLTDGDAWEGIDAFAVEIHTHRKKIIPKELPLNRKRENTRATRRATKRNAILRKNTWAHASRDWRWWKQFVIHRHRFASPLWFKIGARWRVEIMGCATRACHRIRAWSDWQYKRKTPRKNLTFDGKIPKGQYGGGDMWIYATGKYNPSQRKEPDGFFRLAARSWMANTAFIDYKEKRIYAGAGWCPQPIIWMMPLTPCYRTLVDKVTTGDNLFLKWSGMVFVR